MEKYSLGKFQKNEQEAREASNLGAGGLQDARPEPVDIDDIATARWKLIYAKAERKKLLDAAYDEASEENKAFDQMRAVERWGLVEGSEIKLVKVVGDGVSEIKAGAELSGALDFDVAVGKRISLNE